MDISKTTCIENVVSAPRFIGFDTLREYGITEIDVITKTDEFYFDIYKLQNMRYMDNSLVFIMKDEFSEEAKIYEFVGENIVVIKYLK